MLDELLRDYRERKTLGTTDGEDRRHIQTIFTFESFEY